jgi:type I restriction enzyme S subunit
VLLSNAFTEYATADSVRAQIPKVNRESLFSFRTPLPPFALQEAFAVRIADIQAVIAQQERMATAADQLVASLTGQLFHS